MDVHVEREPGRFFDVQHTYTPPALRGRDVAARLTDAAFAHARAQGLKVLPTCSYTQTYLARHPELRALAVSG